MSLRACIPLVFLALSAGCGRVSEREARTLVERYNAAVSEAYRRCDLQLIDSVVAPDGIAGKNLTGLIGVRLDMGLVLDAHLDDLQLVDLEQRKDELQVRTRERWTYRDRRLGTGEPVGQPSEDRYELLYFFKLTKGAWLVTETRFTAPPQVGRKTTPWQMDAKDAHAIVAPAPGAKP